jgi:hypothetical protein
MKSRRQRVYLAVENGKLPRSRRWPLARLPARAGSDGNGAVGQAWNKTNSEVNSPPAARNHAFGRQARNKKRNPQQKQLVTRTPNLRL